MRTFQAVRLAVIASVALTPLAGCSGLGPQVVSTPLVQGTGAGTQFAQGTVPGRGTGTSSFMRPDAVGRRLIFVADRASIIDIYAQAKGNAKVGEIQGDLYVPESVETDNAGNLYVASGQSQTVPVFAPPYTKAPKAILFDTGYTPQDIAVSSRGLVAVGNYPPSVSFYAKNSTKPCATVADARFSDILRVAFDDKDHLYVQAGPNGTSGFSVIGEITGGCKATGIQVLTTANAIGGPGGIKIDKQGRIAIGDQNAAAIYAYNPPVSGSLGSPLTTTPLPASPSLQNFTFLASGHDLYTADSNNLVAEYDYPSGGQPENSIDIQGTALGVAVTPPLVP